jgi:hypothetical protein
MTVCMHVRVLVPPRAPLCAHSPWLFVARCAPPMPMRALSSGDEGFRPVRLGTSVWFNSTWPLLLALPPALPLHADA